MPQFDSISSCSHPNANPFDTSSPQIRNKKKGGYSEDILIELENGNVEEAMKKLEGGKGKKNASRRFFQLLAKMGKMFRFVMVFPFANRKTDGKKQGKEPLLAQTPQKSSTKLMEKMKSLIIALAQFAVPPMTLAAAKSLEKIQVILLKLGQSVQKTARFVRSKAEMVISPFVKFVQMLQKGLETAIRPMIDRYERLKEKGKELRSFIHEKTEPLRKWLDKQVEKFVEKSEWMNKLLGEQAKAVVHTVQRTLEIITYALAPLIIAADGIAKGGEKVKKRIAAQVRKIKHGFGEAKKWAGRQLKKFTALFKKPLNTILLSFVRVYDSLLYRMKIWVDRLIKGFLFVFRFLTVRFPRAVLSVLLRSLR